MKLQIVIISALLVSGCGTTAEISKTTSAPTAFRPGGDQVCKDSYAFETVAAITDVQNQKFKYELKEPGTAEDFELKPGANEINMPGDYLLSGDHTDTSIVINSTGNGVVRLYLSNLKITNSATPIIRVENSALTEIHSLAGSVNVIASSTAADPNAINQHAISSNDNLLITGAGELKVTSSSFDAINTSDSLVIESVNLDVVAGDDGIVGTEHLYINESDISIKAADDGIRTTDATSEKVGLLEIQNSSISVNAGDEGIQSATDLIFFDSSANLETKGHGIRATCRIALSADMKISTDAVGVKSDRGLTVFGGEVQIIRSFEGLESYATRILDGNIDIKSSDDGLSVRKPDDYRDFDKRSAETYDFVMRGGTLKILSSMDAIDSNGNIFFYGGKVIAASDELNVESSFDSEYFFFAEGGTLWGFSHADGEFPAHEDSKNVSMVAFLASDYPKGVTVEILGNGKIIESEISTERFRTIFFSSPELKRGETYEIRVAGKKVAELEAGSQKGKQPGYNRVQR